MQYVVGTVLICVMAGVFYIPFEAHKNGQKNSRSNRSNETEHNIQSMPSVNYNINLNRSRVVVRGKGQVAMASKRLLHMINDEPQAVKAALSASRHFNVPIDVVLAHWYQESFMSPGGDRKGAGGRLALAQIKRHQQTNRREAFLRNERDLLAICRHCGYSCNTIQGSSTGALGPMQFMPSTWMFIRMDANGDGKACPTDLVDAIHGTALKLSNDFKKKGSWDGAMLNYAGVDCPQNRAYVARSRKVRPIFCQIIRRATGQNLPCSMDPPQRLASN